MENNEQFSLTPQKPFETPHEELAFLRERLSKVEGQLEQKQQSPEAHKEAGTALVREYNEQSPEAVLSPKAVLTEKEVEKITLNIPDEAHDAQMGELLGVLQEKGVKNALSVAQKLGNPHIEDDFHRFLVAYLKEGHSARGLKEGMPLRDVLAKTMFEVTLPTDGAGTGEKPLKELLSAMEQFYAGVLSGEGLPISCELAVSSDREEAVFYIAVPDAKKALFEKQLLAVFPQAQVIENRNDYNLFVDGGETVAAVGTLSRFGALPIKTYDAFDADPLNIILSSFSKLAKEGEGAAIQLVLKPHGDYYTKRFGKALERLREGVPAKEALDMPETISEDLAKGVREFFAPGKPKKKEDDTKTMEKTPIDEVAVEHVAAKTAHPIVSCNLRIVASAQTKQRADEILSELQASFHQFDNTQGNALSFTRLKRKPLAEALHRFSFRIYSKQNSFPVSLREATTLFHVPVSHTTTSRELKRSKAATAPAPLDMPRNGILLGVNRDRGVETPVHFAAEDRMRHLYCIGTTGTGKTTLLKNMITQDIAQGNGVCMIDPHGSDIVEVLANIPPERANDVIYFDPSYTQRPMGLNMLEYDPAYPEQKTFVVNELFSIFKKLYGDVPQAMGPNFEQYFRNAASLVIESPESGSTLLDVSRVLSDKAYRQLKLSTCNNPVVVQFWTGVAEKAGGEGALANIVPYITSKFDIFLANDIMRPIVAQQHSAFNFRHIMDERKILLVNLAKGRLGDINSNLLGLIIVGKILMAALSRVDAIGTKQPADFFLYIDEFQNVTTDSIATILSEARKYRLGLSIAHQFIAQIDEKIKNAVFGNVGSLCSFRVGTDDSEYLAKQFEPVFSAGDLMNLDNRHAYVKMLVNGKPQRPFNIETLAPQPGNPAVVEQLKAASYQHYGNDRTQVDAEIMSRYRRETPLTS